MYQLPYKNPENTSDQAPRHNLNQCWIIINWSIMPNLSEILMEIHIFSFNKNAFGNAVGKMAAIGW